jgi:uncharacterized membrane protein (UPF0127 family)
MRVAKTFGQKLKGFLFTEPVADELLILNCYDVHTWLMRYRLHIAFVDSHGRVLKVCNSVPPYRRVRHKKASHTVEAFSQFVDSNSWYKVGDKIDFSKCINTKTE